MTRVKTETPLAPSAAPLARLAPPAAAPSWLWDVFCQVIDNHGDVGVCWRLARELAAHGQRVRLWLDDARALPWLAPGAQAGGFERIEVRPWPSSGELARLPRADVWVEAFGCDITAAIGAGVEAAFAPEFVADFAVSTGVPAGLPLAAPVWINLEYLSAEDWVPRMHALPSPVLHGPMQGAGKWFFYPGFGPGTGGLLREADLPARHARFERRAWLAAHGVRWQGEPLASLFCYEPSALPDLLAQMGQARWHVLVTPGRATLAVQQALATLSEAARPRITFLPHLPQPAYDELLWACDVNFVRGEDSLVRALWAAWLAQRAFVWHIYPQHDGAHHAKLHAFLQRMRAPAGLHDFHCAWNDLPHAPPLRLPAAPELARWQAAQHAAAADLAARPDLAAQLIAFVKEKKHAPAPT
ncbi:MAG: elongation factor P maturation arginine rhamnosyltransferase EarP [Ottowia sp.]